jgi:hypothetical protein
LGKGDTVGDSTGATIGKATLIVIAIVVALILIVVIAYYSIFSAGGTPLPAVAPSPTAPPA